MSLRATCITSAIGAVVFYFLWIVAAADDYTGGLKHAAAVSTAVLTLLCLAVLFGSAGALARRRTRNRS